MKSKRPISIKIFLAVFTILALVFQTGFIFSKYEVDKKYSMILGLIMFIALSFTTVGIYTGFVNESEENKTKALNKIGFIGNVIIFILTIIIMAFAAFTKAS